MPYNLLLWPTIWDCLKLLALCGVNARSTDMVSLRGASTAIVRKSYMPLNNFSIQCIHFTNRIVCHLYAIPRLVKDTPKVPLPSCTDDPDWYGRFQLQYPSSQILAAMNYEQTFRSRVELSIIINELCHYLFDEEESVKSAPWKLIGLIPKLISWYTALPKDLAPENIVFHFQLKLQ